MYRIRILRRALKDIANLPKGYARLVSEHIDRLQDNPLCAAPLVASSETDASAGTPWLLMDEVHDQHNDTPWTPEQLTYALVELAQLHRAYIQNPAPLEQAELLCCDNPWYEKVGATLPEIFQQLDRDYDLSLPSDVRDRVSQQIVALAVQVERLPRTLVHGDFDPGNVVMISEDQIAALDWGLAHCNVPLIDVAHMVGRFDAATSRSMAVRYFEALDLPVFPLRSKEDVLKFVVLGDYLHQVFFLWWHSHVVLSGWEEVDVYKRAIWERSHALAAHVYRKRILCFSSRFIRAWEIFKSKYIGIERLGKSNQ